MKIKTTAFLASTLVATVVGAQSFPEGVDTQGYVELSYVNTESDDDVVLTGDFDIFVGPQTFGSALPIGFDFGLEGVAGNNNNSAHALYAAVSYSFVGAGKVSVGAPRSSYDSVVRSMHARTFNFFASPSERFAFSSSLANAAIGGEEQSYGIRYDSDVRPLVFSGSFNQVDFGATSLDSIGLAMSFTYGEWKVAAAYENVSIDGGASYDNYKIGGDGDLGEYAFGLHYADTNVVAGGAFQAWEAYFSYRPTQDIDLTASVLDYSYTTENTYGLSGKYTFWNNAYAEIAAIRPADAGDVYELNIGWDF